MHYYYYLLKAPTDVTIRLQDIIKDTACKETENFEFPLGLGRRKGYGAYDRVIYTADGKYCGES